MSLIRLEGIRCLSSSEPVRHPANGSGGSGIGRKLRIATDDLKDQTEALKGPPAEQIYVQWIGTSV